MEHQFILSQERGISVKVGVLGTGSWATALSLVLTDNQHEVLMYGIDQGEIEDINHHHQNSKFFQDIRLPDNIMATDNLAAVIKDADYLLVTVPTQFVRSVLEEVVPLLTHRITIINASKGFDLNTGKRISETIREVVPTNLRTEVASLIGPSHAEEVICRQLTTVSAVSLDEKVAKDVQVLFSNTYFRVYSQSDEIGAEYGVALKNVIALASGAIHGLGYGDNTRAALMTRGLAEMTRFGICKGGQPGTYLGLTGIGDLIVTCSSMHSRNFMAGYEIGKADSAKAFMQNNKKTVEGIRTCKVIYEDLKKNYPDIEMPITEAIYQVIYENKKPSEVIKKLMLRDLKEEQ